MQFLIPQEKFKWAQPTRDKNRPARFTPRSATSRPPEIATLLPDQPFVQSTNYQRGSTFHSKLVPVLTLRAFRSMSSSEQFTDGGIWCAILSFFCLAAIKIHYTSTFGFHDRYVRGEDIWGAVEGRCLLRRWLRGRRVKSGWAFREQRPQETLDLGVNKLMTHTTWSGAERGYGRRGN